MDYSPSPTCGRPARDIAVWAGTAGTDRASQPRATTGPAAKGLGNPVDRSAAIFLGRSGRIGNPVNSPEPSIDLSGCRRGEDGAEKPSAASLLPEYNFAGMTVFSSTCGGREAGVILEAEISATDRARRSDFGTDET